MLYENIMQTLSKSYISYATLYKYCTVNMYRSTMCAVAGQIET